MLVIFQPIVEKLLRKILNNTNCSNDKQKTIEFFRYTDHIKSNVNYTHVKFYLCSGMFLET